MTKPHPEYYATATFPEGVKYATASHKAVRGRYEFCVEWKPDASRACLLTAGEITALALEHPNVVTPIHKSEVLPYVRAR